MPLLLFAAGAGAIAAGAAGDSLIIPGEVAKVVLKVVKVLLVLAIRW